MLIPDEIVVEKKLDVKRIVTFQLFSNVLVKTFSVCVWMSPRSCHKFDIIGEYFFRNIVYARRIITGFQEFHGHKHAVAIESVVSSFFS